MTKNGNGAAHDLSVELDLDLLPELIGYQLRLTQIAVFNDFGNSVTDHGISPGRFGVLVLIGANPGLTQSRLAAAAQLDRSTMVAVIDQLETRQLVERRAAPNDRRSNALWLTESGRQVLRGMKRRVRAYETHLASALDAGEASRLTSMLQRIREHLQQGQAGQKKLV